MVLTRLRETSGSIETISLVERPLCDHIKPLVPVIQAKLLQGGGKQTVLAAKAYKRLVAAQDEKAQKSGGHPVCRMRLSGAGCSSRTCVRPQPASAEASSKPQCPASRQPRLLAPAEIRRGHMRNTGPTAMSEKEPEFTNEWEGLLRRFRGQ